MAAPKEGSSFATVVAAVLDKVLQEQLGDHYQLVDSIRRTAHAFRDSAPGADAAQAASQLAALSDVELPLQLNIIRAFAYYGHFLNIAEVSLRYWHAYMRRAAAHEERAAAATSAPCVPAITRPPHGSVHRCTHALSVRCRTAS